MNTIQNPLISKKIPSPTEFLKQALGRPVLVKLTNGLEYKGIIFQHNFRNFNSIRWNYEYRNATM